jgi:hypothetical protein
MAGPPPRIRDGPAAGARRPAGRGRRGDYAVSEARAGCTMTCRSSACAATLASACNSGAWSYTADARGGRTPITPRMRPPASTGR